MVGKMHETMMKDRPSEEAQLDRAMTSMDPILQASLKREQQQRLRRTLIFGGVAMATVIALLLFVFSNPSPLAQPGPKDEPESPPAMAAGATAEQLAKDGWELWRSGRSDVAEQKFKLAVANSPEDTNLWNGLGWSQIGQRKYELAIESFNKCLRLDSKHAGGLNGLGQAHLARREYDLAEPWLRRSSSQGAPAADYGLARLYLLQGEFSKAKKTLAKMKKGGLDGFEGELIEQMVDAANTKSVAADLRARLEPAEPPIEADGDRENASAGALAATGWKHFYAGENAEAEVDFRAALEKEPNMPSAENGLGFALLNQGKEEEALPIFKRLVKAQPAHGGFVNGLARCYEQTGDREKAVEIWAQAEDESRPPSALTWGLARNLVELRRYEEALPYLERIKDGGGGNTSRTDEMIAQCKAALASKE